MLPKVSLVITCFNKKDYIEQMFNSVLAQTYDAMEVIIVDDGSTDGTNELIDSYEHKFYKRGFEIKIIKQENGGCCAAMYSGLLAITGELFCFADCDDELASEYVSTMANFLSENPDYDVCACGFSEIRGGKESIKEFQHNPEEGILPVMLHLAPSATWIYMSTVSYIKKCGLIENFCTERLKTYEPLFIVPYLLGGGKIKYINQPLYRFNIDANGESKVVDDTAVMSYYAHKRYAYEWSLTRITLDQEYKTSLLMLVALAEYLWNYQACFEMGTAASGVGMEKITKTLTERALEFMSYRMGSCLQLLSSDIISSLLTMDHLVRVLIHVLSPDFDAYIHADRVIWYGMLGTKGTRVADIFLPAYAKQPELWDQNADLQSTVCNIPVKVPAFDELTPKSFVVVIPGDKQLVPYIKERCPAQVYHYTDFILFKKFLTLMYIKRTGGQEIV